eukprot:15328043-Alexandrium_andersonii.AAC.1
MLTPIRVGQHPAVHEDPRGGWLRDLTEEGVEPHPGPTTGHWRPTGRQRGHAHLRPDVDTDGPERRLSHVRAIQAAVEALQACGHRL